MKKNIFSIICFLASISVFAQTNPMDFYTTGNSFYNAGNYEQAVLNYTKLIKATKESTVIKTGHINRGLAYDKMKKYDLAIQDFTTAIKLDSSDMASFIDRGLSRMHAEYLLKAKADFNHVVVTNTNKKMKQNALFWLSQINYKTGEMEKVIANCNVYLKNNSKDPEMYFMRASAYSMVKNFKKSIKDYSKVIELYPTSFQSYANRGVAKINSLMMNGNLQPTLRETKSACKDLRKAKKMGDSTVDDMIFIYCEKKK